MTATSRTPRTGPAALAVAAVTMLAACNAGAGDVDGSSGTGRAEQPDTALRVGLVAEPASLDFTTNNGAAIPQALLDNVYETLVEVDQETGEIVPGLATDWQISDDRRTYTFTLTPDAVFSNGRPFTADDAVFSIERVMSDAWTISLKSQLEVVESAQASGEHELTVTLREPSNQWLYAMTTRVGAMFDTEGVADLATDPIGTGPYTFVDWQRGSAITLQRNPDYWGDAPFFEDVTLQYFTDPNALNNAMLTGSIDVVATVQAPESLTEFTGAGADYQVIEGSTNGEVVLSMNNARAPFDDLRVRQAVRSAIDHQALLDTCWAGRGELIGSMVPPTDPWYQDRTGDYPFDPERARSLLEEAGAAGQTVRLRVPTLPYAVACGTVVESQLEDVGLDVEVDELEFPSAWLETVFTAHDYDLSIVAHVEGRDLGTVFGDPDYYTQYDNPELRALLDQADQAPEDEQVTLMQEAAALLSEDAAADFLFLLPNLVVADPDITGLPENAITESFELADLARE